MTRAIEFDGDELTAAQAWHDGQFSMLYAISSTGELRCGSIRPHGDDGPLSDDEWWNDLCDRLESEASHAADIAAQEASEFVDDDDERLLRSIAEKAKLARVQTGS